MAIENAITGVQSLWRLVAKVSAMSTAAFALVVVSFISGCGVREKVQDANSRVAFDGVYFKSRLSADKDDQMAFTITVAGVSRNIDAAREAGRYEATKYCVNNFGNSEVDWTAGPDAPLGSLAISDDTLNLAGRCRG